jgi:lipid-A-disaccharide synthase
VGCGPGYENSLRIFACAIVAAALRAGGSNRDGGLTHIALIAGEASGDALGVSLMRAIKEMRPDTRFSGVGGEEMSREGLNSLFPMSDIAVMGLLPVLARLRQLLSRIRQAAAAVVEDPPDCLVLIDAPDFTHRVARRVRAKAPTVPVIDYVSPTVWAWRPGRARAMRAYVDHVLALLPFEPEAHMRLGGPPCSYVGHPLIERLDELAPAPESTRAKGPLLVLPGSRRAEVRRMTPLYGSVLKLLLKDQPALDVVVPLAPHVANDVRAVVESWPIRPTFVTRTEKYQAFRTARAALVTSGAATLELALAQTPMAVAYRVSRAEASLRFLITVDSIVLPNLILGARVVPEFVQEEATPQALAASVRSLLEDGAQRDVQRSAFVELRARMLQAGASPSAQAARLVLRYAGVA